MEREGGLLHNEDADIRIKRISVILKANRVMWRKLKIHDKMIV